jgi:hypothetical protein
MEAMYLFFAEPEPLANFAPLLLHAARHFTAIVGHSLFGDLFLRDPNTGEYAILLVTTLELVDTGEFEECKFREQILANPEVVHTLLRPEDVAVLARRFGLPAIGEVFIPAPLPVLGGSGTLDTFEKGGLREYLAIVAQSIGGQG